ncbi:MAG: hypothetical protein WAU86_05245 [Oricola sp.]
MKTLGAIAAAVVFFVWDFAQNNGAMTNAAIGQIIQFVRSFGF